MADVWQLNETVALHVFVPAAFARRQQRQLVLLDVYLFADLIAPLLLPDGPPDHCTAGGAGGPLITALPVAAGPQAALASNPVAVVVLLLQS